MKNLLEYYWGDEVSAPIIPKVKSRSFLDMNLMLSAWDFRKLSRKYDKMKAHGLRKYLNLSDFDSRRLMVDSGGFKGYTQNFQLDVGTVLQIYESAQLNPTDHVITLDYAPLPFENATVRMSKINKTIKNFRQMKEKNTQTTMTIHGFSMKELKKSLSCCDTESFVSFPSYFTLLTNKAKDKEGNRIKIMPAKDLENHPECCDFMTHYYKTKSPITLQRLIAKRFLDFMTLYRTNRYDFRVHALGCSASLAMHIFSYTGMIHQFDSANWRVKANYNKIMLSYYDKSVSEAYLGNKKINYGSCLWKSEFDALLLRCACPICEGLSLGQRKEVLSNSTTAGFRARAIHNAYHYRTELEIAQELQGTDNYFPYIDQRVKGSSGFYKMLWKVVKKYFDPLQTLTLDAFLKNKC
jgi:hypothetical protein